MSTFSAGVGRRDHLVGLEVRETIGCDERDARQVLRLVADHQEALMDAWRRFHGQLTTEQFEAAKGTWRGPHARPACRKCALRRRAQPDHCAADDRIEIGFAPNDAEGLQHASTDDLKAIEVEALGLGIRFPTIDVDLYVPALLEGMLGSKRWMADSWAPRLADLTPAKAAGLTRKWQARRPSAQKSYCR